MSYCCRILNSMTYSSWYGISIFFLRSLDPPTTRSESNFDISVETRIAVTPAPRLNIESLEKNEENKSKFKTQCNFNQC